jgi:hypothetical protein
LTGFCTLVLQTVQATSRSQFRSTFEYEVVEYFLINCRVHRLYVKDNFCVTSELVIEYLEENLVIQLVGVESDDLLLLVLV